MRIMFLTASFHPVVGGAESYAFAISTALTERGHEVLIVTDRPQTTEPGQPVPGDPPGVLVRRLEAYRSLLADPSKIFWEQMAYSLCPEVEEALNEVNPHLVLTNSLDTAVLGKTIALDRSIPWVATMHEQAPEREPLGIGRARLVYEVLRPDLVLAGSNFYAQRARAYGAPYQIIYHGIDTERFRPGHEREWTRKQYGITEQETLVVCAGRLKERKGIREAIDAFAALRAGAPHTRLLVVGSISSASLEYADALENRIRASDLAGSVQIDRSVHYGDMPRILAAADIVAQPSLEEGLGLAILEAMSAGRPVVTTDIPGIREILTQKDIAEVVAPRDVHSLAEAMTRLVQDPQRRASMGRRAREHVVRHFSWVRMAQQTDELLTSLVDAAAKRGEELRHV